MAFDSSLTTIGTRVGGVVEKNRPTCGRTVCAVAAGTMWSCATRSLPSSSVQAVSAGSITGTLPGDQPNTSCTSLSGMRGEAGLGVGAIEPPARAPRIEADVGVVEHLRVVGAELDAAHVARGAVRAPAARRSGTCRRGPAAACRRSALVSTRSGVPSCQPLGKWGIGGRFAGSPSGAPCDAHAVMVAISSSRSRRSLTKSP